MILRRFRRARSDAPRNPGAEPRGEDERNYRRIDGDRDRDGLPDYLNRDAQTGDSNNDGLPDYLNRDNLRRR